ncbi:MAG: 2-dehydropantoate 2-reductase [SAR202 cluster bacterium]|nr:2-dehydropantoate 2-reductase [SAR202 cluster bacterium]
MKILVMGSGAVGGYFGAVLHRAGNDVRFVARGEHLKAIRERGLKVESVTAGDFTIRPEAFERPDGSWKADLVLFTVKGYDNPVAIDIMRPAVGEGTSILTLQNGIGSGDALGKAFGKGKVLLGVTYVDASRKDAGFIIEEGGNCNIIFGEEDGSLSPRATTVNEALAAAKINVTLSPNIMFELWKKLIYICGLSGMTCITRSPLKDILAEPRTLDVMREVMREAVAAAKAKGVEMEPGYVEGIIAKWIATGGKNTSSMYTDLIRDNPMEVEVLNGAVARIAHEMRVPALGNEFILACLLPQHKRAMAARNK